MQWLCEWEVNTSFISRCNVLLQLLASTSLSTLVQASLASALGGTLVENRIVF